ncbi:MAG: CoA-binding protein [Bacteroidetes bacterium B1(2017)]|nr:MAG: CoA-binding protein [Bacteroidetes bacterium B1(2017)]
MKRTLVIGASEKPERYAYKASVMLNEYKHDVYPFGQKAGSIEGMPIETNWPKDQSFDTVTLYVGPQNQDSYYEPILALKPKRVVFNPGTENPAFEARLEAAGIKALEACTLVLLRTGQY